MLQVITYNIKLIRLIIDFIYSFDSNKKKEAILNIIYLRKTNIFRFEKLKCKD